MQTCGTLLTGNQGGKALKWLPAQQVQEKRAGRAAGSFRCGDGKIEYHTILPVRSAVGKLLHGKNLRHDGKAQPGPSGEDSAAPPPISPAPGKWRSADLSLILIAVWLTGAAVMLVWNGVAHLRFLRWLHRWSSPVDNWDAVDAFNHLGDQLGLHRRPRLLVCQGLKVPMLAGALRPAILLPQGKITGEELGFSLLHELTHYRRGDIWLKTLAMWVNALYWFNPLAWYMIRLVERDTELACDEDALRRLSPQDYSGYGQTILAAVARLQNRKENTHEE